MISLIPIFISAIISLSHSCEKLSDIKLCDYDNQLQLTFESEGAVECDAEVEVDEAKKSPTIVYSAATVSIHT